MHPVVCREIGIDATRVVLKLRANIFRDVSEDARNRFKISKLHVPIINYKVIILKVIVKRFSQARQIDHPPRIQSKAPLSLLNKDVHHCTREEYNLSP